MSIQFKKLIILANDPLKEYYHKGELVDRYFNPGDFFDEVYFISLSDKEISEEKIQHTVGKAKTKIFPVGKIGLWIFFPFSKGRKEILRLVKVIQPDCIRAYNAHVQGFLAAVISNKLGIIPFVISLHCNPEKDIRPFLNPFKHPLKWFFWNIAKYVFEPMVLKKANKIICVYRSIYDFAEKTCNNKNKIELIYNIIDLDQFKPIEKENKIGNTAKILCVGRLVERKNPENLVKAMPNLDAKLTVIGDGPYRFKIQRIIDKLSLKDKVFLIPSVPNKEIHGYYQEADIFVAVTDYGETSKVMIEAMASGLPVVVNKTRYGRPELLEDTAVDVENSPVGFEKALIGLIANPTGRKMLGSKNREKVLKIYSSMMEEKIISLYKNLLNNDEMDRKKTL